jgi:hypothetical protein
MLQTATEEVHPMGQALVFGLIGSSALVIGGAIGAYWRAPHQISGVLLAFASGTLISALAFELFPEAVHLGGLWPAGLGLIVGGLTFVVVNTALDSWVARSAGDPQQVPALSLEAAEDVSGAQAQQTERVEEAATGGARAAVGFALLAALGGRGPGPGYLMRRFWLNHEKGLDPDELFGGGDDNTIMAAYGSADHVNCGSGTEDTASVDETDIVNENCENATATVPATAPPATTQPAAVTAQRNPSKLPTAAILAA